MQDPNPVRTRTLLELAMQGGTDPEIARRWAGEAAAHREPAVRVEAARALAAQGGRGAMRALVDLLNDPERLVRREAIAGLGTLGESAAVPFLARLLNESDEELQAAAAASLGRIGSGEALPALLTVVQKRSLLQLKKATRGKLAALQRRNDTPGAPAPRSTWRVRGSASDGSSAKFGFRESRRTQKRVGVRPSGRPAALRRDPGRFSAFRRRAGEAPRSLRGFPLLLRRVHSLPARAGDPRNPKPPRQLDSVQRARRNAYDLGRNASRVPRSGESTDLHATSRFSTSIHRL